MPRLVMTTLLVSALTTGMLTERVLAQGTGPKSMTNGATQARQDAHSPPERFSLRDASEGFESLDGAELYDVMDTRIGTVIEVIGDVGAGPVSATDAADSAEASVEAGEKPVGDGQPMDAAATGSSGVGSIAGAGTGDTEGTTANPSLDGTPPEPPGETSNENSADLTSSAEPSSAVGTPENNETDVTLTHAIIEIDNAPGAPGRRVAVPLSMLQIYQRDADLRVYFSGTRDELRAAHAYDEKDRSTLNAFPQN